MTLTSMISSGASSPEFGLTQYRFGAVVLILKATYEDAFAFLSISDAVDTLKYVVRHLQIGTSNQYNKN